MYGLTMEQLSAGIKQQRFFEKWLRGPDISGAMLYVRDPTAKDVRMGFKRGVWVHHRGTTEEHDICVWIRRDCANNVCLIEKIRGVACD